MKKTNHSKDENQLSMNRTQFVKFLMEEYGLYTTIGILSEYEGEHSRLNPNSKDKTIWKIRMAEEKPAYSIKHAADVLKLDILLKEFRFTRQEVRYILGFEIPDNPKEQGENYLFNALKDKKREFKKGEPVDEYLYHTLSLKVLEMEDKGGLHKIDWLKLHRFRQEQTAEHDNLRTTGFSSILVRMNEEEIKKIIREEVGRIDVRSILMRTEHELEEQYGDDAAELTQDEFELEEFDHYAERSDYHGRIWEFYDDTLEELIEAEREEQTIEWMKDHIHREASIFRAFPGLKIRLEDWIHSECQLFYDRLYLTLRDLDLEIASVTFGQSHMSGFLWYQSLNDSRTQCFHTYLERNYLQLRDCSELLRKNLNEKIDKESILQAADSLGLEICV